MQGITPEQALLMMWTTFTFMAVLGVGAILVWAVRTRQFARQDRARYLALTGGIPAAAASGNEGPRAGAPDPLHPCEPRLPDVHTVIPVPACEIIKGGGHVST